MAIVRETLDGGIVRTYSNAGVKIHGGFPDGDYNVVYDPEEAEREYVETDIPVEKETPDTNAPRVFSKLKLKGAIATAGLLPAFKELLAGMEVAPGYSAQEAFDDAVNLSEAHPKFADAVAVAKQILPVTDEQIEAILAASVAD